MKRVIKIKAHLRKGRIVKAHYAVIGVPLRVYARNWKTAERVALSQSETRWGKNRTQALLPLGERKGKLLNEYFFRGVVEGEGLNE